MRYAINPAKNAFFLHFFSKKFAHIKNLLYLCTEFKKQHELQA